MGFIREMFSEFEKEKYDTPVADYLKSLIHCSECGKNNDKNNKYCIHCGHKLKKIPIESKYYKKYCVNCGKKLDKDDDYCGYCGYSSSKNSERIKVCPVCGEWCSDEKYCWNCGHDNHKCIDLVSIFCSKKCPNCNSQYDDCYNYCDECGTKLEKK